VPRASHPLRTAAFVILVLHLIFPALWVIQVALYGPKPNDWLHLKVVADHFVAGDWTHLYSAGADSINPGYLWRYPPFALYVVAPLAWLPPAWCYVLLAAIEVAALAWALVLLHRLAPPPPGTAPLWVLAIVVSAPAMSTIVAGQSSALILLCVAAAASLWTRGRVLTACAVLGLLAVKPNWGVFFGLYAIAIGEWRGAAVMLAVAGALCAAALPLGVDLWGDFFRLSMVNNALLAEYPPYKVITFKGFIDALVGPDSVAHWLWIMSVVGLFAAAYRIWTRPSVPIHHLAMVVLLAVAANPYASFYDALVVALPATVWWSRRRDWPRGAWLTVGWALAAAWCAEQYSYTWTNVLSPFGWDWTPPVSIVGLVTAGWLVLEAWQRRVPSRVSREAV
jgi:hypothetical protein